MTLAVEDIPADLVISVGEIRAAGFCAWGQRRWFEANGFDYHEVLREGVSARAAFETGDAQALHVVELAMKRVA